MNDHMTAAEYRRQYVDPVDVAENPFYSDATKRNILANNKRILKDAGLPQPTEHQIQSTILERLGLLPKAFFWRENSGLMKLGNPGKERFFRAGTPGIPDIMGIYDGFPVGIEVKRPGKKQSTDQKAFQQRFDQCGGVYLVCTDATQIVNQIMAAIAARKGE